MNERTPADEWQRQANGGPDAYSGSADEHANYFSEANALLATYGPATSESAHPVEALSDPGQKFDKPSHQTSLGTAEAPAELAPDPLTALREAIDIGPEAKQKLRVAIDDRITLQSSLHPDNRLLQEQIKKVGDGVYWFYTGEPGEPLPSCFVTCPDDYGRYRVITDPTIDSGLFADFDAEAEQAHNAACETLYGHPARKGRIAQSGNKLEVLLREACEDTPVFQLLRSFRDAVPQVDDRPLTEAEKVAKLAAARADIQIRYDLTDSELTAPTRDERTHRARSELTSAAFRLEGDTVREMRHQRPPSPMRAAKEFFGRAIIGLHRQADPQSIVNSPDQLSTEFGGQHTQMGTLRALIPVQAVRHFELLDASLIHCVAQLNDSTIKSPADDLAEKAIAQLFEDGEANEASFDTAHPLNLHRIITHNLLPIRMAASYRIDVSYGAWLRQPYIAADQILESVPQTSTRSFQSLETYRQPAELVGAEKFKELQNTSVGTVLVDRRPAEQRQDPLLIMTAPVDYSLYEAERPANPNLSLSLAPEALGNSRSRAASAHPYLPGYRLVYADESGTNHRYDFIADPENCFSQRCDIAINQDQVGYLIEHFSTNNLTEVAQAIEAQQPADVAALCDILESQSVYVVPGPNDWQQASVVDGRLQGQCATFADATSKVLSTCLSLNTRVISGKTIAPGSSDITALGHSQVLAVDGNRQFILDTTPAGGPDMRNTSTRLRQFSRAAGRTLLSLFDPKGPLQDEASEDAMTDNPELSTDTQAHFDTKDELPSKAGETPSPEELAADRINRSIQALSGINATFRNQLIVWMNLDRSHQKPEQLYRYMQQHHGRADDPFQITLRQTIRATPRPETFADESQFSDARLTAELADLSRNIHYIENLKTKHEVSRRIVGRPLDTSVAESLQRTLRTIAGHYRAIIDARSNL